MKIALEINSATQIQSCFSNSMILTCILPANATRLSWATSVNYAGITLKPNRRMATLAPPTSTISTSILSGVKPKTFRTHLSLFEETVILLIHNIQYTSLHHVYYKLCRITILPPDWNRNLICTNLVPSAILNYWWWVMFDRLWSATLKMYTTLIKRSWMFW